MAAPAREVVNPPVHVDLLALGPRLLHRLNVSYTATTRDSSTTYCRVNDVLDTLLHVRDHEVLDRRVGAEAGTQLDQRAEELEQSVARLRVRRKGVGGDAATARRVASDDD